MKGLREAKGVTLREVEGSSGVSNAYLSQIEKGRIPTPRILQKLATIYDASYEELMVQAGYWDRNALTVDVSPPPSDREGKEVLNEELARKTPPWRILLADDESPVRETGKQVLTGCGYEVVVAENGKQALEHLLHQHFDAAVIDLKMPGVDGVELLRQIRAQGISLPVWIITGYGSFDSCMACAQLGIEGYLIKPCSMEKLATLIKEGLTTDFESTLPRTSPVASPEKEVLPEGCQPLTSKEKEVLRTRPVALNGESGMRRQPLTPREREVLRYIRYGLTDDEIAKKLFVSSHTVHNHVRNIVEKLGVRNRVEAVSLSFQEDLF
jgi:DNA-binding NarL/FixJ family response regulator